MRTLTPGERRAYELNIWKSYLVQFLGSFQFFWPIWVLYLTDMRGFSLTQVSGLEALFWLVVVLSEVPTGVVADRFGRKTSLVLGIGCTTVAIVVFALATNYWIVLASYVFWGFGLTFQSGADSALLFESLKAVGREREYQRVAGINFGLFSAGALGGMLVGAPLAAATNLSLPILLSASFAFMALLVALTFREPELPEGEVRLDYRKLVGESVRTVWRLPAVRTMLILGGLVLAATNASIVFAQPFLSHHDVPVGWFGVVQAPTRLAGIFGALMAVRATTMFGFRGTLVGSVALLIGSYALLGGWTSVYAFAGLCSVSLTFSLLGPIIADYLNHRIPSNQRATILSFRQLISSMAIAALQLSQGVIADRVSLTAMFWWTAAFIAVVVPPALFWWLRADAEEVPPPVSEIEVAAAGGG